MCVVPRDHLEDVLEHAERFKAVEDAVVEAVRKGEDPVDAHRRVSYDEMTESQAHEPVQVQRLLSTAAGETSFAGYRRPSDGPNLASEDRKAVRGGQTLGLHVLPSETSIESSNRRHQAGD